MSKFIGDVSAYAYAVSKGYTGTEEEYAELMASYATVGQTAVTAAQIATTKASEAATSATTATTKASEATTAAQTATTKAGEASTSASTATSAKDTAVSASQTATSKATEATTAAATAVSAKNDAVSANTAAQSAKTAAQTAQTGAETAAASVEASAAQIQTNADDISELKEDTTQLKSDLNKLYEPYNLYDKESAEDGWFTASDGSNAANSNWCRLRRVYVTAGDKLSISGGRFMTCFFSADTLNPSDVVSGGADYSSGQALITVPSGATVMSVSALVANKGNMLVVKSDSIVTEYLPYGTVKPADTFDVYSKEEVDNILDATVQIVTIGTDYSNLRTALEDIATKHTSYKNRYLVKIPKGTYDIRSLFTSTELATTKGLYVPPFTKIQGIGNPSEVVLNWINPEVNSTQAVLNLDCTAELENLTLHGEKLRYALHDDWTVRKWDGVTPYSEYWYDAFVNKGWVRTVRNCIFEVVDSPVRPAWGAGIVNGVRWLFENCTFITNKAYAGSCHNNTNFSIPCHITFRNCIFTAADTYFLRLTSITNDANGIINQVTFEGCMNTNSLKFILTEEDVSNFGRGCLWAVNGFGNAFGNAKGQISVTDGNDYSSRLKIVD